MFMTIWPLQHVLTSLLLVALCAFNYQAAAYTTASDDTLRALPRPGNDFDIYDGEILAPILIPRVPGTANSTTVLNHFRAFFESNLPQWTIELQNSSFKTPTSGDKEIPFVNFIASRDPPWATAGDTGRLALVAHYDSLGKPEGFIGATDSAAPCAMILHAARSIDSALTEKWSAMQAEGLGSGGFEAVEEHKGVQVILLDGEEAFQSWTATDSIYGARSLAESWDNEMHPAMSTYKNKLSSISLFLLLDLLGAQDPSIPSYFLTTHWAYQNLAKLEERLRMLGQFKSAASKRDLGSGQAGVAQERTRAEGRLWLPEANKDPASSFPSYMMQDDHIPFMARGVEVLHLIPNRFPSVWHRTEDDGEHLDTDTVEDWSTLVTAFAAEWMELDGFFPPGPARNEAARKVKRWSEDVISKTEL